MSLYKIFHKRIEELESSKSKLYFLDLDILGEILKPYYSNTGRPAALQPEIFCSFSLILFQKETIITNWVKKLHSDELLAICIGCTKDKVPSLGSRYDFISILVLSDLSSERTNLKKKIFLQKKTSKTKSLGNNKKLLQKTFSLVAVEPYFKLNLIQQENLTLAGDGTCVHCHSSYY